MPNGAPVSSELIDEVKKRLEACISFESENRSDAVDDLHFLKGDQWPEQMRVMRQLESRPCLTINKLPTFLQQVTNDQRQNKPSIKIHPVDDYADIETAEIIQGMIRHIEYASNADVAYDTAVNSAAAIGFGFFRLITDYCDEQTFDQEIKFRRVRNPLTVYFDPQSVEPDGSDAQYVILSEEMTKDEFQRQYPKASTDENGLPRGTGDRSIVWIGQDKIRVVEYYRIECTKATLCMLSDGSTIWKDEIPQEARGLIVQERPSEKRKVMWYKCTALEVLEEAEIPCRWIPVFPVYGQEIDVDGKVTRAGVVRWAKDPQRMYNYWLPLSLDTPIATPGGWSTIAALKVGDTVFSDDGKPTKVVGKSPVYIGRNCYRIKFGDGSHIDADAEHPWVVEERSKRTAKGIKWERKKLRTDQLDPAKHCIGVAKPLELPNAELPLDPYVLGLWLGDGTSSSGAITASAKDAPFVRAELIARGFRVAEAVQRDWRAPSFTVYGIVGTLRDLGVLNNKHIPAAYMRASVEQRLELLRGLMDTDGTVNVCNGAAMFAQADETFAEQVRELIVSLGVRVGVHRRAGRVSKMANGQEIVSSGTTQLTFTPPVGMEVFRMPRKLEKQTVRRARHARRGQHKIVSVERIASVPVQCIAIDAPSHLFLAGPSMIPTHNTSATEEVSLRPRIPYIMAEGQEEGHENEWGQANVRSFPYLTYKPVTIGGTLAPPPQRQPMADMPVGALQMAMHAADNIKATTGIFDASLGSKSNETSGKAIMARQREGDVANFHYVDNLARSIRHAGRCIMDMIPKIYDTERVVRIMGEDESVESAPVNKALPAPQMDEKTGAIKTVLNNLTVGKYDVTVSVGPAYSTLRQEAADAMIQFGQSWPKLMDIAGDKVVKAMDWPGAEEIAERIKRVIPPEITQDKEDDPEALPPEVEQTLQQATQYIEMLQQQIQGLTAELQSKEADRQLKKYETDTNNLTRIALEEIKQETAQLAGRMRQMEQLIQPRESGVSVSGDE